MDDRSDWLAELICGEDERAEAAAQELATTGDQVLPAVVELTRSRDADIRWWALRALAEWDNSLVIEVLIQALSDPEPAVRECAALGLRRHPDAAAIPHLVTALEDPDHLVADLAADALIDVGSPSVPALLERLETGAASARIQAVRALALIGDQRAIPALIRALENDSMIEEYWATEGLQRMGVGMQYFKP